MGWALFKYSPHRHDPLLESCIIYWAVLEQCNAMWHLVTRIHIWSSYQLNACHCRFHKFRAPELPAIIFFSSTAFTQDTDKAREWQGKGFGKKYRIWKAHSTITLYLYNLLLLITIFFLLTRTFLLRSMYTVTPGSEQIRATIERDGIVSYHNADIRYFQLNNSCCKTLHHDNSLYNSGSLKTHVLVT